MVNGIFDSLRKQNLLILKEETIFKKLNLYSGKDFSELFTNNLTHNEQIFEDFEDIFDLLLEYPSVFYNNKNKFDPLFFKLIGCILPSFEIIFLNQPRKSSEFQENFQILSLEWEENNFGFIR